MTSGTCPAKCLDCKHKFTFDWPLTGPFTCPQCGSLHVMDINVTAITPGDVAFLVHLFALVRRPGAKRRNRLSRRRLLR